MSKYIHKNRNNGVVSLDQDKVLHWERMSDNFAIAPEGKICMIENRGLGYIVDSFDTTIQRFGDRHSMTARERDIVRLVVRGYRHDLIAQKLGIGAGTVRNYRHRLYFKLDIDSERELFNMFLTEITGAPDNHRRSPGNPPAPGINEGS